MASVWALGTVLNVEVPATIRVVVRGRFGLVKALGAAVFRLCPFLLRWASPTFAVVGSRRG